MAQARSAALHDTAQPDWTERLQDRVVPGAASLRQTRQLWRRRLLAALGSVVAAAALAAGGWWYLVASRAVTTDDAYVGASVADITPLINGPVKEVRVHDTEAVHKGDVLVVIDPADEQIAVAQAEANYAESQRRVRQAFATADAARAQLAARSADLKRAELDYGRREALAATGAVSGDELSMTRNALDTARAGVTAAQQELAAQLALVQGGNVDSNPEVQSAKAALDAAKLALARTVIRAPVDGIVAQSQVQTGQRVEVGTTLMTVVPISDVYVDANFKEGQLKRIHVGEPVTLTSDLYGSSVVFHGHVVGMGGGTGSAFAMIPAQNATGNWIKVVQRLPVRIALDPKELADHPLRVGLSMSASVITDGSDLHADHEIGLAARTPSQAMASIAPSPVRSDPPSPPKADPAPALKALADDPPPAAPATAAQTPAPAAAGIAVQIGAFRSEAQAEAARQRFAPAAVSGHQAVIEKADLGVRGIVYRLKLADFRSAADASAECAKLKTQGGSCFLARQ